MRGSSLFPASPGTLQNSGTYGLVSQASVPPSTLSRVSMGLRSSCCPTGPLESKGLTMEGRRRVGPLFPHLSKASSRQPAPAVSAVLGAGGQRLPCTDCPWLTRTAVASCRRPCSAPEGSTTLPGAGPGPSKDLEIQGSCIYPLEVSCSQNPPKDIQVTHHVLLRMALFNHHSP